MNTTEVNIVVNGIQLTKAQAMTIRVALSNFAINLQEHGLGTDETGLAICKGYQNALNEIFDIMRV